MLAQTVSGIFAVGKSIEINESGSDDMEAKQSNFCL